MSAVSGFKLAAALQFWVYRAEEAFVRVLTGVLPSSNAQNA